MTAFELSYLIGETEAFIDVIFNRWVQATFAVLVATYFAAGRLNVLFLRLMGGLYLAYSLAQAASIATLYFVHYPQKSGKSSDAL